MDAQAGLPLCCSQTPEDRFSHDEAQLIGGKFGRSVGHKKFQQGKDVILPLLYVWLKKIDMLFIILILKQFSFRNQLIVIDSKV